jgi:hypothetical protein
MRASLTKAAGWLRVCRSGPRQQPHNTRGQNGGPSKCGACAFDKIGMQMKLENFTSHSPRSTLKLLRVINARDLKPPILFQ